MVVGPNLTGPGATVGGWFGVPALAGPLLFSTLAFGAVDLVIAMGLRPDPLLLARQVAGADHDPSAPSPSFAESMAAAAVVRSRPATLALVAIALAHTVMASVMVMTPVHMRHEGATLEVVGFVISAHVAGMYALSPVAGWLADRFGRVAVIVLGQMLLVVAVAVSGGVPGNAALGTGLFLLGLGWSCALVPGSGYGVLNGIAGLLVVPVLALALGVRRTSIVVLTCGVSGWCRTGVRVLSTPVSHPQSAPTGRVVSGVGNRFSA